jgi:glycosyltransferase involved in cell wall biosynthesis
LCDYIGIVHQFMAPLVSICLPCLNGASFLPERLKSIFDQTVRDWELIVCDSYSEDGSWELFQSFSLDPRIRLYQVPREGLYAGWNECLRRVTGKYVYIATADDTAHEECLERLIEPLTSFPEIDLAMCDFQAIDERGLPIELGRKRVEVDRFYGRWTDAPSIRNGFTEFLWQSCYGPSWLTITSVLFRRELLLKTGLFRQDVGPTADFEWSLRASLATNFAYVPGRLGTWRCHPAQGSGARSPLYKKTRWCLSSLHAVLNDSSAGIPAHWRQVPGWQSEIEAVFRAEMRDAFSLYRGTLLREPSRFLRGMVLALRSDPQFLIDQVLRGFRGGLQYTPNRVAIAQRLVELFRASWPPVALTDFNNAFEFRARDV